MNELVILKGNVVFTNSLVIADGTKNKHKNVKELIAKYENEISEFGPLNVLNGDSTGGRPEQYYLLNEEQATFLMTLFRNKKIVVDFKKKLVHQFYEMREFIIKRQSKEWIATRNQSKFTRREETDSIKKLVGYAEDQGSRNPENYYISLSKLANRAAEITSNGRDNASIEQLSILAVTEKIISNAINESIQADIPYKKIYSDCKSKVEVFINLVQASEKRLCIK